MLEAMQHAENSFVTLTYDDKHLPDGGNLRPEDLSAWLKRLRFHLSPRKIRFFAVGEYGDRSWRPHYHAAVFGLGCCVGGVAIKGVCSCPNCGVVRKTWSFGHTMVGSLEMSSAQYIAGYVVKKMTQADDVRLGGRHPEFARMSLKHGIGASAIPDVASVLMEYNLERKGDVPGGLRHGNAILPLGRYLRRKLRLQVGLPENAPPEYVEALRQGLLPVLDYSKTHEISLSQAFGEVNAQSARNSAARTQFKRRKL